MIADVVLPQPPFKLKKLITFNLQASPFHTLCHLLNLQMKCLTHGTNKSSEGLAPSRVSIDPFDLKLENQLAHILMRRGND